MSLRIYQDVHFNHRGVLQLLLGEEARINNEGFKFNKEDGKREWVSTIQDILNYNAGATADDIDEEFVQALILIAIKNGAETNPQGNSQGKGRGGGGEGGSSGFGG